MRDLGKIKRLRIGVKRVGNNYSTDDNSVSASNLRQTKVIAGGP